MGNITDDGTYENTSLTNPDDFSVTIVDNALYDDFSQEDPSESTKVPESANPTNLATPAENLYDDFSNEDPMEPANSASPMETPTESLDQLYAQVSKKSSKQQESLLDSPVDSQNNVYSEISPGGPSFYQNPETVVEFNNEMNERKLATKGGKDDDNCMGKLKFIIIGIFIGLIIVLVAIVCAIVLTDNRGSKLSRSEGVQGTSVATALASSFPTTPYSTNRTMSTTNPFLHNPSAAYTSHPPSLTSGAGTRMTFRPAISRPTSKEHIITSRPPVISTTRNT